MNQLVQLVGDLTVLKELRSKKIANALEFLEFSIDCKLSIIGNKLGAVDPSTRELALTLLKRIKDYRSQYPRKVQIDFVKSEEMQTSEIEQITVEAAKLLASIAE